MDDPNAGFSHDGQLEISADGRNSRAPSRRGCFQSGDDRALDASFLEAAKDVLETLVGENFYLWSQ